MKHISQCFFSICYVFFVIAFSFLIPTKTFAQSDEAISVKVSPENPRENQTVTITTSSVSTDLDSSDFVWKINNITQKSGKGIKSFSFKTGNIGSATVISLSITSLGSQNTFQRYITIKVNSVDLLFEAVDNYVPPFYRGKKMPAPESLVKVTAIPNAQGLGKTINGKDFIYTWKRNGQVIPAVSGFGKQTYSFNMDYLNNEEVIEVSVRSSNGAYNSAGSTTIKNVKPVLNFYQKIQDQININKSIKNGDTIKNPSTITAVPYFITAKTKTDRNLTYTWKINNEEIPSDNNKNDVTIGAKEGGESSIELSIEHATKFFQDITKSLKITI